MLKIGDKAPPFTLESDSGEKVSLKDFKGRRVVLYFYPKDLTPGCTQEACDFRDSLSQFKKKKVVVLGVSRDPVARHAKFRDKYELSFPLLSDEDGEVCQAYGVWKEKSLYGRKFMGIERTTFVIDANGKIEALYGKVKVKGHAKAVLDELGT
jgi:peroxiredoxin Q/BCP